MSEPRGPRAAGEWLLRGQRSVALVVGLVVLADALVIGLHVAAALVRFPDPVFYLDTDRSYGEMFQYVKFAWLIALVALFAFEHRSWLIALWLPPFVYFLADDALALHERVGLWLVEILGLGDALGLRARDFGEHLVSGAAGVAVMVPLIVGYLAADGRTRWIYRWFAALVGVLLFFGIVLDLVHIVVVEQSTMGDWMGFVEDGGEMLAVSALVVYAVRLNLSGGSTGVPTATADTVSIRSMT